jgi:hypothetical protein
MVGVSKESGGSLLAVFEQACQSLPCPPVMPSEPPALSFVASSATATAAAITAETSSVGADVVCDAGAIAGQAGVSMAKAEVAAELSRPASDTVDDVEGLVIGSCKVVPGAGAGAGAGAGMEEWGGCRHMPSAPLPPRPRARRDSVTSVAHNTSYSTSSGNTPSTATTAIGRQNEEEGGIDSRTEVEGLMDRHSSGDSDRCDVLDASTALRFEEMREKPRVDLSSTGTQSEQSWPHVEEHRGGAEADAAMIIAEMKARLEEVCSV